MSRSRREFPRPVRVAVIKRATRSVGLVEEVYCEKCGQPTKGRFQLDHVIADALGGKPVIENCELICEPCWQVKNPEDTKKAAKVKRVEAKHVGASRPKSTIRAPRAQPKAPRDKLPIPARPPRERFFVKETT